MRLRWKALTGLVATALAAAGLSAWHFAVADTPAGLR